MKLSLSIMDNVSPLIKEMIVLYPRALQTGLSSTGYFVRKLIVDGIKDKSPGGMPYKEHSTVHRYRVIDSIKKSGRRVSNTIFTMAGMKKVKGEKNIKTNRIYSKSRLKVNPPMMGKLRKATRYKVFFNPANMSQLNVKIGWLEDRKLKRSGMTLNQLGMLHEKGGIIPVTSKMKKLFFVAGVHLRKPTINIPARPTIRPVFRKYKNDIVKNFENKVIKKVLSAKKKVFAKAIFKELIK